MERKNKIEKVNIKTISFNHYKENCVVWSLQIEKVNKLIKIKRYGNDYAFDNELEIGDELISINSEKILSLEDFDKEDLNIKLEILLNIKFKDKINQNQKL